MPNNKFLSKLAILIFFVTAIGCDPHVIFEEAVPPGIEKLDKIPVLFTGAFICESDSTYFVASSKIITQVKHHIFRTSIKHIEESQDCTMDDGGLYIRGYNECVPFEYLPGDSIQATIYDTDTLFQIDNKKCIAKSYKGRLFLNYIGQYDKWVTFMLTPNTNGSILWEQINVPEKIETLKNITPNVKTFKTEDDETRYVINPSLVEFDKILEKNYTRECDVLWPMVVEVVYE